MSQASNHHEITFRTVEGERYLRATDVVSILLTLEEDCPSEGAKEVLWILAQVFGTVLDENPVRAYRELNNKGNRCE